MKKLFPSIALISIGLILFTETVAATPETNFRKIRKEFTLSPDNRLQIDYYKELEINSLIASNQLYGETVIVYNPDFQKLKINTAFTRTANGDTLFIPQNAMKETLPAFASQAPAYNHLKERVITHPGLEPGACIHLDYTLLSNDIKHLDIDEILQEEIPVREYQLILNIPANQELHYKLLNLKGKPEITETPQGKRYSWTFKNLAPRTHESFRIKNRTDMPHFIANTYASIKSSIEVLRDNFHFDNDEDITRFTKTLTQNCKNNLDKAFAIKDYIAQHVSTLPIPSEYLNRKIHTPGEVFHRGYSTQAEKINLFITMLQSVGIPASVAVVYPGLQEDAVGGLQPIQQLLVYTLSEGIPLFLTADGHDAVTPELRGKRDQIYLLSASGITPLTVLAASGNINCRLNLNISPATANLSGNISISGGLVPLRPNRLYQEKIKETLAIPGDSVNIRYNKVTPFENDLYVESQSIPVINQNLLFYSLPEAGMGVRSWKILPLDSHRREKLEIPYPIRESYDYIVRLAPGLTLKNPSREIRKKHRCGAVSVKMTQQDDKLYIHREIDLPAAIITPKEYKHFREILRIWQDKDNNTLIISKI